jgi:hypothetical protein
MRIRAGQPRRARSALDAAAGQFRRIGMTGWLRQAEDLALTLA